MGRTNRRFSGAWHFMPLPKTAVLQVLADVAQLVERRLPKPREHSPVLFDGRWFSSGFPFGFQHFCAPKPVITADRGFAFLARSGVLLASGAASTRTTKEER